jgi:hypothetical protein
MKSLYLPVLLAAFVVACGGSDSGPALGGTAAIGAPVDGGTVTIQCAGGAALSTTTSASGKWSVQLSGQTFPCIVQVTGGSIGTMAIHSVAQGAGNTNVTPLTDLIVAAALGQDPAQWLTSSGSTLSTALAQLVAAMPAAQDRLFDSLEAAGYEMPGGDPFSAPFSPVAGDAYDDLLEAIGDALANSGLSYEDFVEDVATGGGEVSVPADAVITASAVAAMPQLNSASLSVDGGVLTMRTNTTTVANAIGAFVGGGRGNKAVLQIPGLHGTKLSDLKNVSFEVRFVDGRRNLAPYFNLLVDLTCNKAAPAPGATLADMRAQRRMVLFTPAAPGGSYITNPPGTDSFSTISFTNESAGWYMTGSPALGMVPHTNTTATGSLTAFDFAQYPDACIVDGVSGDGGLFRDAAANAECGTAAGLAGTAPAACGKAHAGALLSISDSESAAGREWQVRSLKINARSYTFK